MFDVVFKKFLCSIPEFSNTTELISYFKFSIKIFFSELLHLWFSILFFTLRASKEAKLPLKKQLPFFKLTFLNNYKLNFVHQGVNQKTSPSHLY